jgi:N-dimethylarginine dimethylaminohydrolase
MTPNEFGRLTAVALRHPDAAFGDAGRIAAQWRDLAWHSVPDLAAARAEYAAFEALLREAGAEIVHLSNGDGLTLDSLYVRDALIVTPAGLVLAAMGKPARAGEPAANAAALEKAGYPVIGAIEPPGRVEGGDLVWLDGATLVAGHTYRTNPAGIAQLAALVGPGVTVHTVHMPHHKGPADVFHLMSVLSPIDRDLALVYPPLAPVALMDLLADRGIAMVSVPDEEFASMGCNVLATAPRRCIMIAGNPEARRRLEAAGATVHEIEGSEICRKGEGGPTCLTRPLARQA